MRLLHNKKQPSIYKYQMKFNFSVLALSAAAFCGSTAMAQTDDYKNYREVSRDTVDNVTTTTRVVAVTTGLSLLQVEHTVSMATTLVSVVSLEPFLPTLALVSVSG